MIRKLRDRNPNMPQAVIAKKTGCSEANVSQVLKSYLKEITPDELNQFRADKPAILESVQHRALSSLTPEHFTNASFQQIVTGVAILQDKIQLMSGLPTSIHVTALVDVLEQLRKRDDDKR